MPKPVTGAPSLLEQGDHRVDVGGVLLAAADREDALVRQHDTLRARSSSLAMSRRVMPPVPKSGRTCRWREAVDDEVDLLRRVGATAVAGEDVVVALRLDSVGLGYTRQNLARRDAVRAEGGVQLAAGVECG